MQPRLGRGWDQCTAFAMVKMVMGMRMIGRMTMIIMMMMILLSAFAIRMAMRMMNRMK